MNGTLSMSRRRTRASLVSAAGLALTVVGTLLSPAELGAQDETSPGLITLEGEIVDGSNNVPVEGAIVGLPGLGVTAVSDRMGYYRINDVPAGAHAVRVLRLGYEKFEAYVPVNGEEVLALYLTPGPIPLEGIEVTVVGLEDLEWRTAGTSDQGFIGPGEFEELRDRYHSLDHVLRARKLPRARYLPPVQPGGAPPPPTEPGVPAPPSDTNGCVRLTHLSLGTQRPPCAMVVLDGVPIDPVSAGWVFQTSTHDIYSVRFLHGAEAALRYGLRGGYGALLIQTHQGR